MAWPCFASRIALDHRLQSHAAKSEPVIFQPRFLLAPRPYPFSLLVFWF
jgi:hypothetical protein